MDIGNWISLIGIIATALGTVIGWAIEHNAAKKRDDEQSEKISTLAKQVDELEKANVSLKKIAENTPLDANPWGQAEWTGRGHLFKIVNHGTTAVDVTAAGPFGAETYFDLETPAPCTLQPGEAIVYMQQAFGNVSGDAPGIAVTWKHSGKDDIRKTRLVSIMPH